jgi:cysteinyl-tRNA synthetase
MKLFDSLKKEKVSLEQNRVTIYSCGPTVYNFIHIGNARPLIVTDVLVRYLKAKKINVDFLMNVTDVDDKIINEALAKNISDIELAKKFTNEFVNNMRHLNVALPDNLIPISTKINDIVEFIDRLIENGSAYVAEGNVYFDIEKYLSEYGKVSHQKIEELRNGVRIENESHKKSPLDFVLWKKTEVGRKFHTKWSDGRPGWHTECVTLIDNHFSDKVSIHIGGTDLRFPHHENERIQFLALTKKELSDVWFHVGHVMLENQKMSKSVGNIITVNDYLKNNTHNDLRYILLASKYSQPINVTENLIQQAKKWNEKIFSLLKKINWMNAIGEISILSNTPIDSEFNELNFFNEVMMELDNDLNTAQAISIIDKLMKYLNQTLKEKKLDNAFEMFNQVLEVMGFVYEIKNISSSEIEEIKTWKKLIDEKKFTEADTLRSKLEKSNLI